MGIDTGIDIVEVDRVATVLSRHPVRFLTRHFTPTECAQCASSPMRLAARWAGKEAASKALGTGIGPVGWRELEVVGDELSAPRLVLHGRARDRATTLGWNAWSISLSHTGGLAVAVVVATTTRA